MTVTYTDSKRSKYTYAKDEVRLKIGTDYVDEASFLIDASNKITELLNLKLFTKTLRGWFLKMDSEDFVLSLRDHKGRPKYRIQHICGTIYFKER